MFCYTSNNKKTAKHITLTGKIDAIIIISDQLNTRIACNMSIKSAKGLISKIPFIDNFLDEGNNSKIF